MRYIFLFIQCAILASAIAQHQIEIDSVIGSNRDAIHITYTQDDGIYLQNVGGHGVFVDTAQDDGVYVWSTPGGDGFHVQNAGNDGVFVQSAGGDGVVVNNAGGYSMNIQGSKNVNSEIISGHIAQIYNRSTGNNSDVLALKVGRTTNPDAANNFITFFRWDDKGVGKIEGNGSGGITYSTSGADFAECLAPVYADEMITAGDIVGVYEGKVSLRTRDASDVMVITDRPAVLGNQQQESSDDERVSFVGQVFVNVRGKVSAGDWIVASGLEDGTGLAVSFSDITLDHQIVGKAWDSNQDAGVKKVNTVVGLDHSEAKDAIIYSMENRITDLQTQVDELRRLITKE